MLLQSERKGFTLFELMVVIVILGILVALLMPAIYTVRASARRMQCVNHLRQVGIAIASYEAMLGSYPPAHTTSPTRHNLLTFVLPHLGLQMIHDRYDWRQNWNSPVNLRATQVDVSTFRCPSTPSDADYTSDYAACMNLVSPARRALVSSGQVSDRPSWISILQKSRSTPGMVTDGLSNTMMFFEDVGRPTKFAEGHREQGRARGAAWADVHSSFFLHATCRNGSLMNCRNDNEIYSFHKAGCNFLYGDGAVHFVVEDIHSDTFVSLFTREAGDVVVHRKTNNDEDLVSEQ